MDREMRKKVVFLPYDMDTAVGTNNEGDLVFGYSLEDTDYLSEQIINLVDDSMCVDEEECDNAGEYTSNANACRTGELIVSGSTLYNISDSSETASRITVYLEGGGNHTYLTEDSYEYSFTTPAWAETAVVTFYGVHNPASFQVSTIAQGADVFNGQNSVLWCNLREMFQEEIADMYKQLRSNGKLSFEKVEQMFEDHQAKWPEAIFNEDSKYKYIDPLRESADKTYLPMLQGSKAEQRKWWLYNRFRYMDSKFNAGDALTDYIQLRGYNKSNITITPYADIYPSVKFGSYLVQTRGMRNQAYTIVCPLDRLNDTEIYIYSASALSSIGDISQLKVGLADFSRATKLQEIKIGDSNPSYSNPNMYALNFGRNTLLKKVDARNCVGLGLEHQGGTQRTVDMSLCTGLEEAYFDGTNIAALYLSNGGELRKLHLPGTVTNLTVRNQTRLNEFVCPDFSHITTLWLDNPSNAIDTLAIVRSMPTGGRVRLFNFHWEMDGLGDVIQMFDKLDTMRGMDQNGNQISIDQAVYGTIHAGTATATQIALINNRYPDVTVTYDTLYPTLTYMNGDGTQALYYEAVAQGNNGTKMLPDDKEADDQYTYISMGWSLTPGGSVDQNAIANIQTDRTVYAVYQPVLRSYTITWKRGPEDGNDTLKTTTVSYGEIPSYGYSAPVSIRGTAYAFYAWTPEISAVDGPATYTAIFQLPVTLRYYDYDGTLLDTETVAYGRNGTWSGTPSRAATEQYTYAFFGWSRTQGGAADPTARREMTADRNVYAVYTSSLRSYTVSFVRANEDGGGTLQSSVFVYGSIPSYTGSAPVSIRGEDFEFNGWDQAITPVTGTKTYTAAFVDMGLPLLTYLRGTMTDYESSTATTVGSYAFYQRDLLQNITTTAYNIETYSFGGCSNVQTIDFTNPIEVITIRPYAFRGSTKLKNVFIRSNKVSNLLNVNSFDNGVFNTGDACIYVPSELINNYKTATNWSQFANRIFPISNYPVTNLDTISDDWNTIISKINAGTATYSIGDTKSIDLGTEGIIRMYIVGENQDELADESGNKAKYTWWAGVMPSTLKTINPAYEANTIGTGGLGGWEHSGLRSYLAENGIIWNLLPNALKANDGIKSVIKYSQSVDVNGDIQSNVETIDKLFLFGRVEIGNDPGLVNNIGESKSPIYPYFSSSIFTAGRLSTGTPSSFWLRTAGSYNYFYEVTDSGGFTLSSPVTSLRGVCFGFCT